MYAAALLAVFIILALGYSRFTPPLCCGRGDVGESGLPVGRLPEGAGGGGMQQTYYEPPGGSDGAGGAKARGQYIVEQYGGDRGANF